MTSMNVADPERTDAPAAYPPAPEGQVLYVIGDIHGRTDLLERVFRAIDDDKARPRDRDQHLARPRDDAGVAPGDGPQKPKADIPHRPSFIGPDLTINGQIKAKGDVRIDGQVHGNVSAGRIVVGRSANIEGSLAAKDVTISGTIRGTVRGENLRLGPTSWVEAEMFHNSLVIEQGCQFEGKSRHVDHPLRGGEATGNQRSGDGLEIYLGDYIDRGEDSRGVVEALIERAEQVETVFLRGNHEQFLLDFLAGRFDLSNWKQVGGLQTLNSYGVQPGQLSFLLSQASLRKDLGAALTRRHGRFFLDTVPYFVAGPYLFVHAGVRPGIPLEQQQPADLMGIRTQFLEFDGDLGYIVVHGHTPVPQPEFKQNRINLDTEAYSTGRLTCLRIDGNGPALLEV